MAIMLHVKTDVIHQFRRHEGDTGSPEVQVAILTTNIKNITEHLKTHRKDFHSRRGLLLQVSQRKRLLKYLKKISNERYLSVIGALGIRH